MQNSKTIIPLSCGTVLKGGTYVYRIERMAGHGAFGITYVASTRMKMQGPLGMMDADVKVAIKEFYCSKINGREGNAVTCSNEKTFTDYKRMFLREARNLEKMQHPHIVKVLEAFEANNTYYYSMEYLDGGSLDSYLQEWDGLPEREALNLIAQVGDALQFMHEHRMLDLDLKPKNIMRRAGDGTLLLIDFGLSKQFDAKGEPESSTSIGLGTPGYAPIEQANYQKGDGFPVTLDVYALGATLYKMLVGHAPDAASDILNNGFPESELRQRRISSKTIAAIRHAMEPRKIDRTSSMKAFMKELGLECEEERPVVKGGDDTEITEEDDVTILKKGVESEVFVVPTDTQWIKISYREYGIPSPSNFDVSITPLGMQIEHYYRGEKSVKRSSFTEQRFRDFVTKLNSLRIPCSSIKPDDGEGGTRLNLSFQNAKGENLKRLSTRREKEDDFLYLVENTNVNIAYEIEHLLPELVEFVLESIKKKDAADKPVDVTTPKKENVSGENKEGCWSYWLGVLLVLPVFVGWIPIYWGLYYSRNYTSYDFNHYSYLLFFIPFTIVSWILSWREIAKSWKGKVGYSVVYAIPLLIFIRLLFEPFQVISPEKGGYEWRNIFGKEIVDDYHHFVKTDYIKFENGKKEGLVDLNENVVVPCDYNRVEHLYEDVFMIYKGGDGYGIYKDDKEVIPCMYDNLHPFDPMMADHCFFIACKEDKYGVIDMDGVVKLDFKYDKIELIDGNSDDSLLKIGVKKTASSVSQMLWGVYSFWDKKEILECKYILIKDVVYNNKRAFECTYHAGLAGFIKSYVDRNGNVLKKEQIK